MKELSFEVEGRPPAKNEAQSMLGERHSHAPRVIQLLETAMRGAAAASFPGFGAAPIGLALEVGCPRDRNRSDATNYLGGVADVLEDKSRRGTLAHLGDLARFGLYDNDSQIEEVRYRWRDQERPSYRVRIWTLE
jgi:hypothetical protein